MTVKLSELRNGVQFKGSITSQRSGKTYTGIFVKLGGAETCLVEKPTLADKLPPRLLSEHPPVHDAARGGVRYIRPDVMVLILSSSNLPAGRLPIILDDLDVVDFEVVDIQYVVSRYNHPAPPDSLVFRTPQLPLPIELDEDLRTGGV